MAAKMQSGKAVRVEVADRPYLLTFAHYAQGGTYILCHRVSSGEVERLLAAYPVMTATPNRIKLKGDGEVNAVIVPATLGGGPAFKVSR